MSSNSNKSTKSSHHQLTLASGAPLGDKLHSLSLGPRGPLLFPDVAYLEETAHFNRERIPERVVHAKGMAAMGSFKVTDNTKIAKYCKASVFREKGKKTDCLARFSVVAGESGSADSVRDTRGFAVRFYTDQGNWDLVGNNSPVFFIRDPIQFTAFIHSQKRNPQTHLKDPNAFWDFIALNPASIHQVCILFSDRGIPDGFRTMHGFGVNTFKLVNDQDQLHYAKFHWRCQQKIKNLEPQIAERLAGQDPDYALRDLQEAIRKKKDYPVWRLNFQVMSPDEASQLKWSPFDVTKVWPHKQFPLMEIGKLTLDKLPVDYFGQVEQVALCPANLVPGIEPSPDKMLLGRMFSYQDAQRYRMGSNYNQLPVNRPQCPVMTPTYRDGCMNFMYDSVASMANYVPNSSAAKEQLTNRALAEAGEPVASDVDSKPRRVDDDNDDNYSQATALWTSVLSKDSQRRLVDNIVSHLSSANFKIQELMIEHFAKVHEDLGKGVEKGLKKKASK